MLKLDKREHARDGINLIVNFKERDISNPYSMGLTSNCSHEGMCIEASTIDLNPGHPVKIILTYPDSDLSVTITGEVMWKKNGWYKCTAGVRLTELDGDTDKKMRELISDAKKIRAVPLPVAEGPKSEPPSDAEEVPLQDKVKSGDNQSASQMPKKVEMHMATPSTQSSFSKAPPRESEPAGTEVVFIEKRKKRYWLFISLASLFLIIGAAIFAVTSVKSVSEDRGAAVLAQEEPASTAPVAAKKSMDKIQYADDIFSSIEYGSPDMQRSPSEKILPGTLSPAGETPIPKALQAEITFAVNSAFVNPAGQRELDNIIETLLDRPGTGVKVQGHADSIGHELYNLDIAMRRALAVKDFFMRRGIKEDQIMITVYGDAYPVAPNNTASGRMKNRRVEIITIPAAD